MWQLLAWPWLANAAAGGLVVLAAGALAVRLCRQPARRARLIVLTIVGAVAVPCLSSIGLGLPISVRLPVGVWQAPARPPTLVGTPASIPGGIPIDSLRAAEPLASGDVAPPHVARRPAASPDAEQSRRGRWTSTAASILGDVPWRRVVLVAYAMASAGVLAWWLLGQALLWQMTRGARPVPRAVRDRFLELSGPEGARVRLLASDRIALPFTYTWSRPVILLPSELCDSDDEALNYALAHEWSHVDRGDAWAWNLAALAGAVLFYQPLFWWLRRQLRLCQDYLADDRAAAAGSPEDYATCLVRLARLGGRPRARAIAVAMPAMGIFDRPSNLSRRVAMLINDRGPIEHRCPRLWSLITAAAAALAILAVAGLRADITPTDDQKAQGPKPQTREAAPPVKADPKGGTLHYSGKVKDEKTGRPIAGATVIVRRKVVGLPGPDRIIAETRHTTDAEGVYSFTIPPEQVAEKQLYIELDVEHPDYAAQSGFGYGLGLIRRDEARGHRPFFENITLYPARPVLGRVETPDGTPAEGVEIIAYSRRGKVVAGPLDAGSTVTVKTDRDGRFRVPVTTPGLGMLWIIPRNFAPESHAIPADRRGEFGTFTLKKGITVTGRAFDTQGKPTVGMFLQVERDRDSSPDRELLESLAASDLIARGAETDAEGRFALNPLPPGVYVVRPVEQQEVPGKGWIRRPLPGVFAPLKVTLSEGVTPQPIEIRAAPHVVVEGGWVDSKGKPRRGSEIWIIGHIDGQSWHTMVDPAADGKFSTRVPHGMDHFQITIFPGSLKSTRYRLGRGEKLEAGQVIMLRTLDRDIKGLELIRYDRTGVVVKAIARDGRPLKDVEVGGEYTSERAMAGFGHGLKSGGNTEINFEPQADGRFRSNEVVPDREVKITAYADGFKPASRTLKLPEGKTEEVELVLGPK
jgi:beta-lactamase regulating signal transducer with metallopeptidase domain